jgi:hypothetical protein
MDLYKAEHGAAPTPTQLDAIMQEKMHSEKRRSRKSLYIFKSLVSKIDKLLLGK